MEYLRVLRALVTLVLLFTTQIYSQKILSDRKKCGDPHCESLMLRVSAKEDYSGPDCRFLTFKTGDEINVYYKLTGRREDLWQGSKGRAYGFFPKDAVTIEEVYLREEMEVPAQEIDFVCLNGGEYFFENEDSVIGDIREDPADHSVQGGGYPTEGQPDAIAQVAPEPEAPQRESWAPSGIAGWFGMGKSNENKDAETDAKNIDLETNLETEPQKPPEEAPPEKSGWLGGRIKTFLPFGGQRDETQSEDNEDYGEDASTSTQQTEQEQSNTNMDGEDSKPKWFHFRISEVLGFAAKSEKKEELNLNADAADNEMISESLEKEDQSEISRPDQTDKTEDNIKEEDTTLPNAQKKDAQAKDEFNILKEKHQSEGPREDALTKTDSSFQDKGGDYGEEHRLEEEDHSTKTLVPTQADDYQEQVAKNINEYSNTLSQAIDLNGQGHEVNSGVDEHSKDDVQILMEGHLPKPLEEALTTEKDKAIQDEDYGEKLRYQEAEHPTQTSQAEDPGEHIEMIREYSETLSQENVDCLKHGSVITDDHDKTEVINPEELHQSKITQENQWTMEERSKDEVTFKRLDETFNPIRTPEQDEDPNLEDNIYLASHHLIDKPESTESTRINQKTKDDTEEKTGEEHKIETKGSIERKDKPVCTTSMDHDFLSTAHMGSRCDGHHRFTVSSTYGADDKTTMGGMETEGPGTRVETDSQCVTLGSADPGNRATSPKLRSQEEDSESSEDELSSCSDAEEAAGSSCMKPPHQPWGAEETPVPIQSDPGGLAFAVMLGKICSGYNEVHTQYLMPIRSLVTSKISKECPGSGGGVTPAQENVIILLQEKGETVAEKLHQLDFLAGTMTSKDAPNL